MKKYLFTLFIFYSLFSKGQNPLVKMWDKRYGGTNGEMLYNFLQTTDGGYLLGGWSVSGISGDKTQDTCGLHDYWIVKIDSIGNKQWDKDLGGSSYDLFCALDQTFDGGYILCGNSMSQITCDKTQNNWASSNYDYWIVRIDSIGNKIWDKRFGGTSYDFAIAIEQTKDSGFIIGGYSVSGIGGDKTQGSQGVDDYWIIKIDSSGNIQWDKRFGGTSNDLLFSLVVTSDGGYLLGGTSASGIGGDKTEPSRNTGNSIGDYWVVKIDSLGNKEWDKTFGGDDEDWLYSLVQTQNGDYILCGYSYSEISGDKTVQNWGAPGSSDIWLVRIDSQGNKIWDKNYGGINSEESENGKILLTLDGGFLFSCQSYSPISGNKTENNLGNEQTWVVKLDSLGNKLWDKTLLTDCGGNDDEVGNAIQTRDGCYAIANCTSAGIGGDKSQNGWGPVITGDYWIAIFCENLKANFTSPSFICPGSCIDFVNLSLHAASYIWSFPGATPDTSTDINPTNICYATPGSYDVQLIASNANGSDTLLLTNYITVYPSPPPQSITQSSDTLFAIAGATTYQWYFNGNIINGATDYFYVAPQSGDYNVVATDVNGCEVEAAIFNVVADLPSTVDSGQWTIFPNPVGDKVKIQIPIPARLPHSGGAIGIEVKSGTAPQGVLRTIEISIYNVLGEKVFLAVDYRLMTVDCRLLSSGLYYLEITSCEKTFRSKFVKQ